MLRHHCHCTPSPPWLLAIILQDEIILNLLIIIERNVLNALMHRWFSIVSTGRSPYVIVRLMSVNALWLLVHFINIEITEKQIALNMNEESGCTSPKVYRRTLKILRLAIPAILAILITFAYILINIAFAGNLKDGSRVLAGIGLSNVLNNGLWFTTFNGFSGALQTMVSQNASKKNFE